MVGTQKCVFCGKDIEPGTGMAYGSNLHVKSIGGTFCHPMLLFLGFFLNVIKNRVCQSGD
jgi:hypothetical protein